MISEIEKKLLGGTAYRIFCDELEKHLEATSTLFITTEWSPEQLEEAAARYHTIRGGAGFFNLSQLATLAGQLEKRLQGEQTEMLIAEVENLRELDRQLREVASAIPHPAKT